MLMVERLHGRGGGFVQAGRKGNYIFLSDVTSPTSHQNLEAEVLVILIDPNFDLTLTD
jgi:hypothetical protein